MMITRPPTFQPLRSYPEAAVCGRFQPPHKEHLDYILRALDCCGFLWIGLVVRLRREEMSPNTPAPHRWLPHANPLTYAERVEIFTDALLDRAVSRSQFGFVPFPLDEPELLGEYVARDIPILVSRCDSWSEEKQRGLVAAGYKVEVLFERPPEHIEGRAIRSELIAGRDGWKDLVPEATIRAVDRFHLKDRLTRLANRAHEPPAQPEIASDDASRRG